MLRPSETTSITPSQLKTTPFHWPFEYPKLYDPSRGSAEAMRKEVQYDLLATAIPAMSYAAAANPLNKLTPVQGADRNFDMMDLKNNDAWPAERETQWWHSDFRDVAMSYTWKMYEKMIIEGNLDEE